jgi:uncharacterized protein with HEPN domain
MSKRETELFLFDIVISILKIKYIIAKFQSADALKHDFIHWDSVIREYEIIGEATNNLIKHNILDTQQRAIVDFRNVLIHEYFGISEEEVWDISTNFLDEYQNLIIQKIDSKSTLIDKLIEENQHLIFIVNFLKELKRDV